MKLHKEGKAMKGILIGIDIALFVTDVVVACVIAAKTPKAAEAEYEFD